jgi:hypothetical protein
MASASARAMNAEIGRRMASCMSMAIPAPASARPRPELREQRVADLDEVADDDSPRTRRSARRVAVDGHDRADVCIPTLCWIAR